MEKRYIVENDMGGQGFEIYIVMAISEEDAIQKVKAKSLLSDKLTVKWLAYPLEENEIIQLVNHYYSEL